MRSSLRSWRRLRHSTLPQNEAGSLWRWRVPKVHKVNAQIIFHSKESWRDLNIEFNAALHYVKELYRSSQLES